MATKKSTILHKGMCVVGEWQPCLSSIHAIRCMCHHTTMCCCVGLPCIRALTVCCCCMSCRMADVCDSVALASCSRRSGTGVSPAPSPSPWVCVGGGRCGGGGANRSHTLTHKGKCPHRSTPTPNTSTLLMTNAPFLKGCGIPAAALGPSLGLQSSLLLARRHCLPGRM